MPIPRWAAAFPPASPGTPTASASPICRDADLVALDTGSGREAPLLAAERVKHPVTGKALSLAEHAWTKGGDRLLVVADGDLFVVDAKSGVARAIVRTPETEELAELSPDGRRVAFLRRMTSSSPTSSRAGKPASPGRDPTPSSTGASTGSTKRSWPAAGPEAFWWSPTSRRRGLPAARPGARARPSPSWTSCPCTTR